MRVSTPDPEEPPVHDGEIAIGDIRTSDGPADLKLPTVKFVHYPGSQQLILWLPRPGHQGYETLTVTRNGEVIEQAEVMSRLNGSVQILFATLTWPEGDYAITITNTDGFRHEVTLTKLPEGQPLPVEPSPPLPPPSDKPIVYRDGFGKEIPNEDLNLRDKVIRDITRKFTRRLEYEGNFRAGTIHYIDGERRISFWHEMAGGDMKFFIDIPTEEQWEARTGMLLSEREDIINFLADRVKEEQASSWRYEITASAINFY